jgi:hypothetical protein
VFKWSEEPDDLDYLVAVADRVNRLRAVGYPAPRYLTPLAIPGAVVVLQEAMSGRCDDDLIRTALRLNDPQAGQGDQPSVVGGTF